MLIVTIRTDKPEAEIGLYDNQKRLDYVIWLAHRELAETIHIKLKELLNKHAKAWSDIGGVVCLTGPGSFTGLRIGIAAANALAYGLDIPIVGADGESWIVEGIKRLNKGDNDSIVVPRYGSPPHVTLPRK